MKLFYAPTSPFVRKVLVVAHELGLEERIERLPGAAHPVNRDPAIVAQNPLGQVPTFITDDGQVLYDSRVVCEYLNDQAGGSLFPASGEARWRALTRQALGDGLMGAAILVRYETFVRPEDRRWDGWIDGQLDKVRTALAAIEREAASLGDQLDIGTITFGCALGYLDLRFADLGWRDGHPETARWFERFGARPSMAATRPQA